MATVQRFDEAQTGCLVMGACVVSADAPDRSCTKCGRAWNSEGRTRPDRSGGGLQP
ncbi:hypothetical protein [Mariniluteicoccus flavus]